LNINIALKLGTCWNHHQLSLYWTCHPVRQNSQERRLVNIQFLTVYMVKMCVETSLYSFKLS